MFRWKTAKMPKAKVAMMKRRKRMRKGRSLKERGPEL